MTVGTVVPGHPSWTRPEPPAPPPVHAAGVHIDPRQAAALLVVALQAQQIDADSAVGVLDVLHIGQHLTPASRRRLLLDATAYNGMAEDLQAGAYQVVATTDPHPRPEALLDAAGGCAEDLRDALLAELTGQP